MKLTRGAILLLLPAVTVFTLLLAGPIANLTAESFRLFVPGRVGSAKDAPWTLINYAELLEPAYVSYFLDTFRIALMASLIGLVIGYVIAYFVARVRSAGVRKLAIGFLVAMMFLSILVRVYSLELTFGPVGFLTEVSGLLGLGRNSRAMIEILVIAGLVHFVTPMVTLTLVGTIQNVDPRLAEAAQALGAPRWKAHLTVTVPLSMRGVISAFLITYTLSISAFVIPMVLGKGRVLFVSNLIYSRFGEIANYPSGAAISIVLLLLSLVIVYIISDVALRRWERG